MYTGVMYRNSRCPCDVDRRSVQAPSRRARDRIAIDSTLLPKIWMSYFLLLSEYPDEHFMESYVRVCRDTLDPDAIVRSRTTAATRPLPVMARRARAHTPLT
jgi:hypothetical protein